MWKAVKATICKTSIEDKVFCFSIFPSQQWITKCSDVTINLFSQSFGKYTWIRLHDCCGSDLGVFPGHLHRNCLHNLPQEVSITEGPCLLRTKMPSRKISNEMMRLQRLWLSSGSQVAWGTCARITFWAQFPCQGYIFSKNSPANFDENPLR